MLVFRRGADIGYGEGVYVYVTIVCVISALWKTMSFSSWPLFVVIALITLVVAVCEAWIQRGKSGRIDSILNEFDDEDLRFNDYENRLEDSFFKYVARTDDYDRNEVPWENGDKPVQVKMSAYLRQVLLTHITHMDTIGRHL